MKTPNMTTLSFPPKEKFNLQVVDINNDVVSDIECRIHVFIPSSGHLQLFTTDVNAKTLFFGYQEYNLAAKDMIRGVSRVSLMWNEEPNVKLNLFLDNDSSLSSPKTDEEIEEMDRRYIEETNRKIKAGGKPSMTSMRVQLIPRK